MGSTNDNDNDKTHTKSDTQAAMKSVKLRGYGVRR